jgi:hypothetical protein
MAESMYEMVEELEKKVKVVIKAISKSRLIAVFREWKKRVDKCIKNRGNYFE